MTLVGAAPFLRLHFPVLDNFMDPFVDFCLGADRQRFDSGEKSQYTVDAGIRPGIRIAFLKGCTLMLQFGFLGYEHRTVTGESKSGRFTPFRLGQTDVRVGLLFYLK